MTQFGSNQPQRRWKSFNRARKYLRKLGSANAQQDTAQFQRFQILCAHYAVKSGMSEKLRTCANGHLLQMG